MTVQSRDGDSVGEPSHTEDRINWSRRRTHARQRAADSRQRRIAYSLGALPAAPAPGESVARYGGNGDSLPGGVLPAPSMGPVDRTIAPDAAGPLPALDADC
jgi:hypothetical protein